MESRDDHCRIASITDRLHHAGESVVYASRALPSTPVRIAFSTDWFVGRVRRWVVWSHPLVTSAPAGRAGAQCRRPAGARPAGPRPDQPVWAYLLANGEGRKTGGTRARVGQGCEGDAGAGLRKTRRQSKPRAAARMARNPCGQS